MPDDNKMVMNLFPWPPASRLLLLAMRILVGLLHDADDSAGDVLNQYCRQMRSQQQEKLGIDVLGCLNYFQWNY
jgi:hypothetical protein